MDDPTAHTTRRVTRLLTILVGLTALLLVGLAAGALVAWREYRDLRGAATLAMGEGSARAVVEEVSTRQRAASKQLAAIAADAERQIAQFERRAAAIRSQDGGGPIDAAAKAMNISQLMMDQSLLALKQTAALQDVLAKSSGPLASADAVGGIADGDGAGAASEERAKQRAGRRPVR
jgi:hypothetical protein